MSFILALQDSALW